MNRQELFDVISESINEGKYRCIHEQEDKNGNKNIVVTLGNSFCMYVNEDGTCIIRAQGNRSMLRVSVEQLKALSEEALEEARQRKIQERKSAITQWKAQRDILEAKIQEAEELNDQEGGTTTGDPAPAVDKKWYQKILSVKC